MHWRHDVTSKGFYVPSKKRTNSFNKIMCCSIRKATLFKKPMLKHSAWLQLDVWHHICPNPLPPIRDRRDRKFWDDTDIDTFCGPEPRPILIPILRLGLHRDRYWYWYHENVPGLILIPILYLIRILPRPCKKCSGLWIDTDTDTETQEIPGSRLILILAALVSVLSIRYRYSRLSLVDCECIL